MKFRDWLENIYIKKTGENIALSSINKYVSTIENINKEMLEMKVINKSIKEMNNDELDIAIEKIFNNKKFKIKDETGNRMYSCAIKRYRCYKHYTSELEEFNDDIINDKVTEIERITLSRIGQQEFRKKLLKKYENKCIITGLSIRQVLVASHIKPWSVSSNSEKIDINNGLILSATYDRLFDSGLITFNRKGNILISSIVSTDDMKILGIKKDMKINLKIEGKMVEYLKYHNEMIFVR